MLQHKKKNIKINYNKELPGGGSLSIKVQRHKIHIHTRDVGYTYQNQINKVHKLSKFLQLSYSKSLWYCQYIYIYTVGTESIQTPLNFSLFVILQPFAKII